MREEREVLEDHADLAGADLAEFAVAERGQVLAVEEDAARGGLQESVEHPQESRLAGAGQAHDDEDLARCDGEGRVDDGGGGAVGAQFLPVGSFAEPFDCLVGSSAEHLVQMLGF